MTHTRTITSCILLSLMVLLPPTPTEAAEADVPFFDFAGFSFANGDWFSPGNTTTVVAELNEIQPNPLWILDFDLNEYTVVARDLVVASAQAYGTFVEVSFVGGTIGLYEDPSQNGTYAPDPPNGFVPSSFDDGTPLLLGAFSELTVFYDTGTGIGTVTGILDWEGGTRLAELENPSSWVLFGGVSNHPGLGIPAGYALAWDPQLYGPDLPSPAESSSWGRIKAAYSK